MDSLDHCRERLEALKQQTNVREAPTYTVARRRRWWRHIAGGVVMLLAALGSVTPAHAEVIQCGDVLGPGGRFELEHDLECDFHAVTVRDGAILDLNGHIVSCGQAGAFRCIVLTGAGAQLLNGAVRLTRTGIVLEGTGRHTVRNVTSTVADGNIVVLSDQNQLINVYADSVINPAFVIAGHHNRLIDNIARCFDLSIGGGCILVSGDENRLINNFATATEGLRPSAGFSITGHNNVLQGNRALVNDEVGIEVSGTGNRLSRNTALQNALDLRDTNGDCAHNTWERNTFRTSDPACIGQRTGGSVAELVR